MARWGINQIIGPEDSSHKPKNVISEICKEADCQNCQ